MHVTTADRFKILLVNLLLVAVLAPVVQEAGGVVSLVVLRVVAVLPLVAGAYAIAERKRQFYVLLGLGALSVVLRLVGTAEHEHLLDIASDIVMIVCLTLVAITILAYVLRVERVTTGVIAAGLCVYLLAGM